MRPDGARDVCGGHCGSLKRREVELAGLSPCITVNGVEYAAHPGSTMHPDGRSDLYVVCKSPQPHPHWSSIEGPRVDWQREG